VIYPEQERADSVLAVRWCLSHETANHFMSEDEAYIAFVIADGNNGNEKRFLFPLEQAFAYLPFWRPGKFLIRTFILHGDGGKARFLSEVHPGRYHFRVFGEDGSYHPEWLTGEEKVERTPVYDVEDMELDEYEHKVPKEGAQPIRFDEERWFQEFGPKIWEDSVQEPVALEIGEEFFAKEPPAWVARWANRMFLTNPVDQCSLRRRIIFAFTLQPFILGGWYILHALLGLLWGFVGLSLGKKLDLDYFKWSNVSDTPSDLWDSYSDNYLGKLIEKSDLFWLLTPAVWGVLFFIGLVLHWTGALRWMGIDFSWFWSALSGVGLIALGGTVIIIGICGVVWVFNLLSSLVPDKLRFFSLSRWWSNKRDQWAEQDREDRIKKRKERERLRAAKIDLISCPVGPDKKPLKADVRELPKELKTARIRWAGFKKKFCQPFAR